MDVWDSGFHQGVISPQKHYVQDHEDLTLKAAAAAELLCY